MQSRRKGLQVTLNISKSIKKNSLNNGIFSLLEVWIRINYIYIVYLCSLENENGNELQGVIVFLAHGDEVT